MVFFVQWVRKKPTTKRLVCTHSIIITQKHHRKQKQDSKHDGNYSFETTPRPFSQDAWNQEKQRRLGGQTDWLCWVRCTAHFEHQSNRWLRGHCLSRGDPHLSALHQDQRGHPHASAVTNRRNVLVVSIQLWRLQRHKGVHRAHHLRSWCS